MNSNFIELLKPLLENEGVIQPGSNWHKLAGGRSNFVWQVGDKVCKLFKSNRASDLFPNNPNNEYYALKFLEGSLIAPKVVYFNKLSIGFVLVYNFIDGFVCEKPAEEIAKTLSRLHAIPPKNVLKNKRDSSSKSLLSQCSKLLIGASLDNLSLPSDPNIENSSDLSIIHCDPVPGNAILLRDEAVLIDWQCCAIGDGSEDIACALSPAMQYLYGKGDLNIEVQQRFLKAYSLKKNIERYHLLGHIYHFRIAAYCFWRAKNGENDYGEAFLKEKQYLDAKYN